MTVFAWVLVAVQLVVTVLCAVGLFRPDGIAGAGLPLRRGAVAMLVSCVLPVPVLIAADAHAAAWGVWGAGVIAAAIVYGLADAARDTPASPGRAGDG